MQMIYRKTFVFSVFVCILENSLKNILQYLEQSKMKINKKLETAIPPPQTTGNPPQTTINNPQTHHHSKTHFIKTKNKPKTNKSKPTNQTNKSKNKPTPVLIESGSGAGFNRRPVLETHHQQQSNPWQIGARVPRLTEPRNASPSFAVPRRFVLHQRFELVLAVLSAPPPSKAAISTQSPVKSRSRSRPSPSPSSGPKPRSQHTEPIE
jgi:hypothetical protein